MKTRHHTHEEQFDVTPDRLFALLITPSSIRKWWGAARAVVIGQQGGTWSAAWGDHEDDPDYITSAVIADFDPPRRLLLDNYRYYAKSEPHPFEILFVTEFRITPQHNGCLLTVTQDGFPAGSDGDDFLKACERGWADTFSGIRRFLAESPP